MPTTHRERHMRWMGKLWGDLLTCQIKRIKNREYKFYILESKVSKSK